MYQQTQTIHEAYTGDPVTGATAVPVYQTAAYTYATAEELADIFAGRAPGDVYSRISNPTTQILERRLAALESGPQGRAVGCIATGSGMAAITSVLMGLLRSGDEILSASGIFGGTSSLFLNTLNRFGVSTTFVEGDDAEDYVRAINKKTRVLFIEAVGNPRMNVPDIPAIARAAHAHNLLLIVDGTLIPPTVASMGALGADIVIHSTTKYINGHGTAIGGALIDTGNYDWRTGIFPDLQERARRAGPYAFLGYLRQVIHRDLGGCAAPWNSFLMLQGLETLTLRARLHEENARNLAAWLESHPCVSHVAHPSLPSSPFHVRVQQLFQGYGGGLLTFRVGSRARTFALINAMKLARNMTNIGDAKTLILHPASTIFHEFDEAERERMGVFEDLVRVSVGIEDFRDIQEDFEQALAAAPTLDAAAVPETQGV